MVYGKLFSLLIVALRLAVQLVEHGSDCGTDKMSAGLSLGKFGTAGSLQKADHDAESTCLSGQSCQRSLA